MVNVAANQHGFGFGDWRRVDGFSEAVLSWIAATEAA
jgi:60 kDa SS-A/Ro ribonucleoprotein